MYPTLTVFRTGHSWLRQKNDPGLRDKLLRKLLRISFWEYKTNDYVGSEFKRYMDQQESFLTTFKRQKMTWLATSNGIADSAKPFRKTLLKADSSWDGSARAGQT